MKRLNVCLIAMTSDAPIREKQILLAPYVLKRYAENSVRPKENVSIKVLDFPYHAEPGEIARQVLSLDPDVAGLSFYIWNYLELMECARILKEKKPALIIMAGGPMVSFNAEETIKAHPCIDAVSRDDTCGEIIFTDFLQSLIDGNGMGGARGIVFRSDGNELINTPIPDKNAINRTAESSPFIKHDIILNDENGYYVTIETAKGCASDCGYCCWGGTRRKIEYYPIDRVLEEIEIIYNNPRVKHVLFTDSNMLFNKERLAKIVKKMEQQKYYRAISTRMHLNILSIDEELAVILSGIPGFSFDFGLQTANPVALKSIGKHRATAGQFREKILLLKEKVPNFKFGVDLMIGLPGDTLEEFKKTLDFCFSLQPRRFFMAYPICLMPGTRFYRERDELKINYSRKHPQVIVSTDTFPERDMYEAVRIGTWVQILTYYYPAISKFFYFKCKGAVRGERFDLMKRWIDVIDNEVCLFKDVDIIDAESNPTKEWYMTKEKLLRRASSARVADTIYSKLYELSGRPGLNSPGEDIFLGLKVFSYYKENNLNPVGRKGTAFLPNEFCSDYAHDKLVNLHSIFSSEPCGADNFQEG